MEIESMGSNSPPKGSSAALNSSTSAAEIRQLCCGIILSQMDGSLRTSVWGWDGLGAWATKAETREKIFGNVLPKNILPHDNRVHITTLLVSQCRNFMFAGTSIGTVRAYAWPPTNHDVAYAECWAHSSPVNSIRQSPLGNMLMSAADDGTIFMIHFHLDQKPKAAPAGPDGAPGGLSLSEMMAEYTAPVITFNKEVVLMAADEVDDHHRLVARLKNDMMDAASKAEYRFHEMETELQETLKRRNENHESVIK
jgi:hypothetical protein